MKCFRLMISEYAIIPEVFAERSYSSREVCDMRLSSLMRGLRSGGVVRNLREGEWSQFFDADPTLYRRAPKILEGLYGRLRIAKPALSHVPLNSSEWCSEALESHKKDPLKAIIADDANADKFGNCAPIRSISKLEDARWWDRHSVELQRTAADYLKNLGPVLRYSNSLMFIDPHFDPKTDRYWKSIEPLFRACGDGDRSPEIEIHRVQRLRIGRERICDQMELRKRFNGRFRKVVNDLRLDVKVFVWDKFHDRYLISNLIGVSLPNGFDVDENEVKTTRWTRLDRTDRSGVRGEFHRNSKDHRLCWKSPWSMEDL